MKHWNDECGHEEDAYRGSFSLVSGDKFDVYVFEDRGSGRPHVCIRYGEEGHEYISPGPLEQFLQTCRVPAMVPGSYKIASEIIYASYKG